MRQFKKSKNLDKILRKLMKKDNKLYNNLLSKIEEILTINDVEHYKNLRHDLKEFKRVHIGSFVLIFKYDKDKDLVYLTNFDHHDNIYKSK